MSELHGVEPIDLGQRPRNQGESHPRAFGSPLPVGSSGQAPASQDAVPPIGRALANAAVPSSDDEDYPSNAQRAMSMLRMALPLVQRVLPLIEGQCCFGSRQSPRASPTHTSTRRPRQP